uniref:GPI ethanolamine phosphate transferase 1 n=1 Tax=Strongyloides papillosus TaxID=174720 RepID=A0A0N5B755_STREA
MMFDTKITIIYVTCLYCNISSFNINLISYSSLFYKVLLTPQKEKVEDDGDIKESTPESFEIDINSIDVDEGLTTLSRINSRSTSITSRISIKSIDEKTNDSKLIEKEFTDTGSVKKIVYLKYFKATRYHLAFLFAFGYMVYNALQLGRSLWLSKWSNDYDIIANNGTINPSGIPLGVRLGVYSSFGLLESLGFFVLCLHSFLVL